MSIERKIEAEVRVRELVRKLCLPDPDDVLYGADEVVLLWEELKVALVVELDQ